MKFRLLAGLVFLVIVLIYAFFVYPNLNLDNQLVDLVSIIILFVIGSILGIVGRKLDKD
ncbi:hypothetical protein [Staphylococcus gallinarum]|uniref:hypothetical protein n=1 Tax=Staphylococcus gallinarum TaxID=1293 RepID=UPI0030BAC13C